MPSVCFYFQVHQPWRIKNFCAFDVGKNCGYFDHDGEGKLNNRKMLEKVSRTCYKPANELLLKLIKKHPEFKISFSFSGIALEQFEKFNPEVLDSFKALVDTGNVEILSETYHHSLSSVFSKREFRKQVELHKSKIKKIFGVTPGVFRNTELIYSDDIAEEVKSLGFKAMLAEGADHILNSRSPNFLYRSQGPNGLKLLLKNYKLSDDIAFRFSDKTWPDHPLSAKKFSEWILGHEGKADVLNLFMDYETFGEHQWEGSGIFKFLESLPKEILKHSDNNFITPSEAVNKFEPVDEFQAPFCVSWADKERDLSAWLSNSIQCRALREVYNLEDDVLKTKDRQIIEDWRKLQTSDHFYYMCTKYFEDGDVHKYFNPYQSPFEAFGVFMNVLRDLKIRVKISLKGKVKIVQTGKFPAKLA